MYNINIIIKIWPEFNPYKAIRENTRYKNIIKERYLTHDDKYYFKINRVDPVNF